MTEEIKHIIRSRTFKTIIYGIVALLALLFIFQAGVYVGFEKASFYNRIGESYFHTVSGNGNDPVMGISKGEFESAHGAVGQIVSIKSPFVVIEDQAGIEKTVQIATSTEIKNASGDEALEDLKIGDFVVVFGAPSSKDPILLAKLIRVLPPPSSQN